MSRFQRMVAIPESEYLQMSTLQQVKQPLAQKFYNTDQEYENAATLSDPCARVAVRAAKLEEMKSLNEEMRNYLNIVTPKPYRSRAERLLSVLEPHLKWNERGELIDSTTNRPIGNSQLSDLIQHAVRDRRRNISPTGWSHFLTRLRMHNVPHMLLNMPTLDELGSSKPLTSKRSVPTPLSRKRKRDLSPPSLTETKEKKTTRKRAIPKRLLEYFPY